MYAADPRYHRSFGSLWYWLPNVPLSGHRFLDRAERSDSTIIGTFGISGLARIVFRCRILMVDMVTKHYTAILRQRKPDRFSPIFPFQKKYHAL